MKFKKNLLEVLDTGVFRGWTCQDLYFTCKILVSLSRYNDAIIQITPTGDYVTYVYGVKPKAVYLRCLLLFITPALSSVTDVRFNRFL